MVLTTNPFANHVIRSCSSNFFLLACKPIIVGGPFTAQCLVASSTKAITCFSGQR